MKRRSAYALCLFCSFSLVACRNNRLAFKEAAEITVSIGDDRNIRQCTVFEYDGLQYISYFHPGDTTLVVRSFPSGTTVRRYDLSGVSSASRGYYPVMSFYIHTLDSVFIHPVNLNSVFLVDSLSRIVNSWNITMPFGGEAYDYALVSSESIPIVYKKGLLHILSVRLDLSLGNGADERMKYFNTTPDLTVELHSNGYLIKHACGAWPDIYRKGNYFNDSWPSRTINSAGQLIYGSGVEAGLNVYENGRLVKTVPAQSRFISETSPYPEDSIGHFDYWRRYELSEPRYMGIYYDKYRRLYYRLVGHKFDAVGADGLLNSHLDKPRSMIVLDEDFNILDELPVDVKKYVLQSFMVLPEGILFTKREQKGGSGNIEFVLMKVEVHTEQ